MKFFSWLFDTGKNTEKEILEGFVDEETGKVYKTEYALKAAKRRRLWIQ